MKRPKILVPTDFSEYAQNALKYAIGLAKDLEGELVLLHVILYNDSIFRMPGKKAEANTRKYNQAKGQLDEAMSFVKKTCAGLPVKDILDADLAERAIVNAIDAESIDYVVMGTHGASGLRDKIFGSFTSNVLLVSSCPVFTVPASADFSSIQTIVCATEMHDSENRALTRSLELAERFKAEIIFLNVGADVDQQVQQFVHFQKKVRQLTSYPKLDYATVESKDVPGAIENYVTWKNPDLVITLGKERSFFDQLFGEKVTKKLSLHTQIPLLSFPFQHFK